MTGAAEVPALIRRITRIAGWIYSKGWAEANAGNISVRVDRTDDIPIDPQGPPRELPFPMRELDGARFLISGTGRRMREAAETPDQYVGLIRIVDGGTRYRLLWGAGPATSELPAHLGIHAMAARARPRIRAVIHTHPTDIIALSHLPDLQDEKALNDILFRLHPETRVHLPGRIARIPYNIPGSAELGLATAAALRFHDVVLWCLHGVVAVADRLDRALDRIEVLEKAAAIYIRARSTGARPVGMTDEQIEATLAAFGIEP